jgi:hypothetical protein
VYQTLHFSDDGVLRVRSGIRNRATEKIFPVLLPARAIEDADPGWLTARLRSPVVFGTYLTVGSLITCLIPFVQELKPFAPNLPAVISSAGQPAKAASGSRLEIAFSGSIRGITDFNGPFFINSIREYGTNNYALDMPERVSTGKRGFGEGGWLPFTVTGADQREEASGSPASDLVSLPVTISGQWNFIEDESSRLSGAGGGEPLFNRNCPSVALDESGNAFVVMQAPEPTLLDTVIDGLLARCNSTLFEYDDDGPHEFNLEDFRATMDAADSDREEEAKAVAAGPEAIAQRDREIQIRNDLEAAKRDDLYRRQPWSVESRRLMAFIGALPGDRRAEVIYPEGEPF